MKKFITSESYCIPCLALGLSEYVLSNWSANFSLILTNKPCFPRCPCYKYDLFRIAIMCFWNLQTFAWSNNSRNTWPNSPVSIWLWARRTRSSFRYSLIVAAFVAKRTCGVLTIRDFWVFAMLLCLTESRKSQLDGPKGLFVMHLVKRECAADCTYSLKLSLKPLILIQSCTLLAVNFPPTQTWSNTSLTIWCSDSTVLDQDTIDIPAPTAVKLTLQFCTLCWRECSDWRLSVAVRLVKVEVVRNW